MGSKVYPSIVLLGLGLQWGGGTVPAIASEAVTAAPSEELLAPLAETARPSFSAEAEAIVLRDLLADEPLSTLPDRPLSNVLAQQDLPPSTPVSQLQDIDPRHWAAQALRQLALNYQCLPSAFREDAILSRYEFAEVLSVCLAAIQQNLLEVTADNVTREELAIAQRLQQEFQAELAELDQRLDSLETQVSTLEDQQFVKRTTLSGLVELILLDTFGESLNSLPGRRPTGTMPNANTTFTSGNVLLEVQAKVRQQDFVRIGLLYSNLPGNGRTHTGTDMTRLNAIPGSGSDISLNNLFYQTRYADRGVLRVGSTGLVANIIIPDLSPVRANSRFGARSSIYRPGVGAGFLTNYQVNDWLALGGGYTVGGGDAANPSEGIFSAQNRFIVQTTFTPTPQLGVALTYSHLYQDSPINLTGLNGSRNAQAPFGDTTATSAHHFGLQGNYRVNRRLGIGGWVNYAQAIAEAETPIGGGTIGTVNNGDRADIWSWALGMTISDAFRRGNELGFVFGMPPKAIHNDFAPFEDDDGTSYHVEMYYSHRITPRFFIMPGLYAVFNPEHNSDNNTQVVGLIRSSMRF
ncbi:MAG: iron uptake porin [Prochlorotrichaceae cyanobacterium]